MLVVGAVGWWIIRVNSFGESHSPNLIERKPSEESKTTPEVRSHPRVKKASNHIPQVSPEPVAVESRPSSEANPAPALIAADIPPALFPSVDQIAKGAGKKRITEVFGAPALSVTASDAGHILETYVYARDSGQALTFVRFQDGKVLSAYSKSSDLR